ASAYHASSGASPSPARIRPRTSSCTACSAATTRERGTVETSAANAALESSRSIEGIALRGSSRCALMVGAPDAPAAAEALAVPAPYPAGYVSSPAGSAWGPAEIGRAHV